MFELFDRTGLKLFGLRGTLGRIRNTLLNFATKNIFFGGLTVFSVCLNSLTKLALSYSGLGAHWVELGTRGKGGIVLLSSCNFWVSLVVLSIKTDILYWVISHFDPLK